MSGIKRTNRIILADRRLALEAAAQARLDEVRSRLAEFESRMSERLASTKTAGAVDEAQRSSEEYSKLKQEINILQSPLSPYAYASMIALEKQGYQLRECAGEGEIKAWFEKVDEPSKTLALHVKQPDPSQDSWIEELEMTTFAEDECWDVVDVYDAGMKEMGFRKGKREVIRPRHDGGKAHIRPKPTERERGKSRG